jgi:hypothetical protein
MDARLRQLLSSFIGARAEYALARLEFAMRHERVPAPPVIDRLPDASATTLRDSWPHVHSQLEHASAYLKRTERESGSTVKGDAIFRRLRGTVREMEQYARAVDWVRNVTAGEES